MQPVPHRVVVLLYPQLCLFEFGIAAELFGLPRPELQRRWYDFAVATTGAPAVRSGIAGLRIGGAGGLVSLRRADTIVVPGWSGPEVRPSPALKAALRAAHARGARLLSICSGAFLLGHCGLLDGRRATTHWRYAEQFRHCFPRATLVVDALYVEDGTIITSAGSAAGIDAGLHLIRGDFGSAIANQVAQRLVMPPHREGGQRQFVATPLPTRRLSRFDAVFDWALERLPQGIGAADLARAAAMSERNFHRRFRQSVGTTPAHWLQQQRLRIAKALLEDATVELARVAEASGFASQEAFRAAFRRGVGVSPSAYRRSFTGSH